MPLGRCEVRNKLRGVSCMNIDDSPEWGYRGNARMEFVPLLSGFTMFHNLDRAVAIASSQNSIFIFC